MRIHELAKELDVSSKELLETLEKMGVTGKSASSSVPEDLVPRLRASGGKATKAAKPRQVMEPPPKPRAKPKPKTAKRKATPAPTEEEQPAEAAATPAAAVRRPQPRHRPPRQPARLRRRTASPAPLRLPPCRRSRHRSRPQPPSAAPDGPGAAGGSGLHAAALRGEDQPVARPTS